MLLSLCKHPPLKNSRWSIRSKTVTVWITWNERFDYTHDYLISPTGRVSLWEKKSGSIIGRIQFVSFSYLSNIEILINFFEFLPRSLFRGFSIDSTSFVLVAWLWQLWPSQMFLLVENRYLEWPLILADLKPVKFVVTRSLVGLRSYKAMWSLATK